MSLEDQIRPAAATVVPLPAEVDLTCASEIRDTLLSTLNRGGCHLVVDARGVTFMDSSGINALVKARERAERLGGSLHVVSDARCVRRLMEVTQLERVLHLVPEMQDALDCVARPDIMHSCGS